MRRDNRIAYLDHELLSTSFEFVEQINSTERYNRRHMLSVWWTQCDAFGGHCVMHLVDAVMYLVDTVMHLVDTV